MRYDVTEPPHPLLSAEARQLPKPELQSQNELAELLLELNTGDAYTERDTINQLLIYVTLQVNLQVEVGIEGQAYTSTSDAGRSRTFRGDVAPPPVHATALAGVRKIRNGGTPLGFRAVTSHRGSADTTTTSEAAARARAAGY